MSLSLSTINALTQILSSNPKELQSVLKLSSVDILKSLGSQRYSIDIGGKILNATSDETLTEGKRYWAELTQSSSKPLTLSKMIAMPPQMQNFSDQNFHYTLKTLQTLLNTKEPLQENKQFLLEKIVQASSKEEFTHLSTLLLSLHHNVLSLPLVFYNSFALLQLKKRYNKSSKTIYLEFYAALEHLGPISGLVSYKEHTISMTLNVVYKKTKQFLEDTMQNISYPITIELCESIHPLYENSSSSLLDLSI